MRFPVRFIGFTLLKKNRKKAVTKSGLTTLY